MPEDNIRNFPIKDLHQEEGAEDLSTSPEMGPYIRFAMAVVSNADPTQELEAIRQLPVQKRYVWRVASALKWAFADFDHLSVEADKHTLTSEDFSKLADLLKFRPVQFCLLLKALVGTGEMQRIMVEAIKLAKQQG